MSVCGDAVISERGGENSNQNTIDKQLMTIKQRKKGKLLISHRYNHLPLLHSCPGGVQ